MSASDPLPESFVLVDAAFVERIEGADLDDARLALAERAIARADEWERLGFSERAADFRRHAARLFERAL